jgi:hypothetical protein
MLKKVTMVKLRSKKEGIDIIDAFENLIKDSRDTWRGRSKTLSMSQNIELSRNNKSNSVAVNATERAGPVRISKEDL